MAISSSSSSSCCSSCVVVVPLLVLLGWLTVTAAAGGTTRNLREIMIGRCHSYQNLINPLAFKTGYVVVVVVVAVVVVVVVVVANHQPTSIQERVRCWCCWRCCC